MASIRSVTAFFHRFEVLKIRPRERARAHRSLRGPDREAAPRLDRAAPSGDRVVVEALLAAGTDPTRTNADGTSAADIAQESGRAEIAELIGRPAEAPAERVAERRRRFVRLLCAALAAGSIASCATPPVSASGPSPSPSPSTPTLPSPYGNAELFFEPGSIVWCGLFVSYRAPSGSRSGELKIGATTFAASSGNPAPFAQRIGDDVRPGGSVCISGTAVRSETTANLLADFSVTAAPFGAMSHTAIRATPCGAITDLFITDLPSGGFITLAGTKFLVGGARPASDAVQLPAPTDLRLGLRVCIAGTTLVRVSDAATFEAVGGRVTVMP